MKPILMYNPSLKDHGK